MEFDDDYLQRDRYYREHILGGDEYDGEYEGDYGDMEEQGYDAIADDVYDNAPQIGCTPNMFGDSRYDEEQSDEAAAMQRVWRDYHVLGYADDDGDDRNATHRTARQDHTRPSGGIMPLPMSKKYREMSAQRLKEQEKQEAERIIRVNRTVCIAAAAAVLISMLLIFL
ncbi:MAG TPA: hypothetical protein DC009_03645 [Porphyromonadaceae bacterium]|nr:hypothetical protein [Porphyromonadaceae bacterium]